MKILCVAVGNREEAFIENSFSDGVNIIFSDENNKGKTIIIQSILYALGNKPIFPSSFEYKKYYYYLKFEHNETEYVIVRGGDSFVFKAPDGIRLLDGMSELKRYWNDNIFTLPVIPFNGEKKIVDMELFCQLFFVPQDGKDTATIFNSGYYHKDDFKNMLLYYAEDYSADVSVEEMKKIQEQIKELKQKRQEQIELCDFYKTASPATEYLSRIKDQEAFNKRVSEMDSITDKMTEIRKRRNHLASKKALWNGTLKELRSLNRDIDVGELRCMDCDSTHITYKGKGKATYSFDVSTPEMRKQIIDSIQERIKATSEEISRCDFEITQFQNELNRLMDDDEITVENIVAYKSGFRSVTDIETAIAELDHQIGTLTGQLEAGISSTNEAKKKRDDYYTSLIDCMNRIRIKIDPESDSDYTDLFTKRGSVISGSEETVFYTSKILAILEIIKHECPVIIDSFRAEDLSSEKEKRVLNLLASTANQCILTTTLKTEEKGKYNSISGIAVIDYTKHQSCKLLKKTIVPDFGKLVSTIGIKL